MHTHEKFITFFLFHKAIFTQFQHTGATGVKAGLFMRKYALSIDLQQHQPYILRWNGYVNLYYPLTLSYCYTLFTTICLSCSL